MAVSTSETPTITTSAVSVISSPHGLLRRKQRKINIRDLQAAVKYGTKEAGFPCPRTGENRWKYTHADVVYITDASSRHEITSWPAPAAGLDIPTVQVTEAIKREHEMADLRVRTSHASWTSHTVAVVDQSGSMRNTDLADGATRSDAVWITLALDFVAKRLESGEASGSDVLSVILMNDHSKVLFRQRPLDWLLYNDLVTYLRTATPMHAGNYFPALNAAEELLRSNEHGGCALMLLFLSDGRPSDIMPTRADLCGYTTSRKYQHLVQERIGVLASQFGRRLTVATIGFGSAEENFSVLNTMATTSEDYGSVGIFQTPALTVESLGKAMSSLTESVTETKTELTHLGDPSIQRTVRSVVRESRRAVDDLRLSSEWYHYEASDLQRVVRGSGHKRAPWEDVELESSCTNSGVAMKKTIFGEGAERMVRKFRLVTEQGEFHGPLLVAKESRFVEDSAKGILEFHLVFCETQAHASRLAQVFNQKLSLIPGVTNRTPRVKFLDCRVFVVQDRNYGRIGLLVEDMLDPMKYMKWNNNAGHVAGQAAVSAHQASGPLRPPIFEIQEEEVEEDEEEEGLQTGIRDVSINIQDEDIPQAFTHFTYRYTERKMMNAQVLGVMQGSQSPVDTQ
eukprot:gene14698-17366_t